MMDRYNEQKKNDYEMQRNVIYNAIINTKRKRNTRVIPLFPEENEKSTMEILQEREELFGRNA